MRVSLRAFRKVILRLHLNLLWLRIWRGRQINYEVEGWGGYAKPPPEMCKIVYLRIRSVGVFDEGVWFRRMAIGVILMIRYCLIDLSPL